MKILHINSLGYEAGGTETGIKILKAELIKKGHEVKILSSDHINGSELFSDYNFKHSDNLILSLLFRLFNPYSFTKVKKLLSKYKPDVIHLHRMDYISPSVLFLLKKYPTVMTINGPEDFIKSLLIWFFPHTFFKEDNISEKNLNLKGKLHYIFHAYLQSYIYKLALKNVNLFIVPSNYFMKTVDKDIKPIITVPNGVKLLKFSKKSVCNYKLLYVGRIDKTKGIDYLLHSLHQIIEKYPKTTLSIIGEGIYKKKLIHLTKKLNLKKHVKFIPWQKSEKVAKYYKTADIIVMPSIWPESFGKVGPEAMSVGRPIIGSKVGGIPDWLIDENTGYLVEPKNSQQITEKVLKLFSNKNLREEMGKNARKKAEEFSIEKQIDAIENIYNKLLNK